MIKCKTEKCEITPIFQRSLCGNFISRLKETCFNIWTCIVIVTHDKFLQEKCQVFHGSECLLPLMVYLTCFVTFTFIVV